MFEKTFTFWRRLVGTADASNASANQDRRLWVRHAIDLRGNLQISEPAESEKILANVRDLSIGGASLVVDRIVDAGEMVVLELPADRGEIRTVLACVVRVSQQPDGRWSLGCVFSRELSQEDLDRVGAQKIAASADDDKRTWVRFSCEIHAAYRKVGDPTNQAFPAQVLNISANGISLAVTQTLAAGGLLNVDLLDKAGLVARTMLACIVHTATRPGGDFAIGCNFIRELSEDELQSLL
jgi:c-di-GMP-binding flagellar brake protein YcgR